MTVAPAIFHKLDQVMQDSAAVVVGEEVPEIVHIPLVRNVFAAKQLQEAALEAAPCQTPAD
jgi:hypothetical protein